MRGFVQAFRENNRLVSEHLGVATKINDRRLYRVFFDWVSQVEHLDHQEDIDRADRIVFLGGLALRELLRTRPVTVVDEANINWSEAQPDEEKSTEQIAKFWLEGFIYTNFCICSISAVHEQEFGKPRELDKIAYDLHSWWSFRENASEDVNVSIGFLDLFFGITPNWLAPASASARMRSTAVSHDQTPVLDSETPG